MDCIFPPEVDLHFYRARYPDLRALSDRRLVEHYERHGRREGRQASAPARRAGFVPLFADIRPILEIGPFNKPMVAGDGVFYFDVMDREALEKRAQTIGRKGVVPHIDFVSPTGDLSIIDRSFAAVCSAHCIEHQPDLLDHFKQVGRLLGAGGRYFLAIPDKRFCFDHFIPESTVADIIEAHEQKHRVHSLANIVRQVGLSTHNGAPRHWAADHADAGYREGIPDRLRKALKVYQSANGRYIDVHAWRFTPKSFRQICELLFEAGLSPLEPVRVYDTPRPTPEFTAILEKAGDAG